VPASEVVPGEQLGIGRTAEVFALGPDRVVKVIRPGFPEGLGAAEAAAAARVSKTMAAAPRFFGASRVEGRYALIYERISGTSMLDRLSARPWLVVNLARAFAGLHVAMHESDGTGLPTLKDAYAHAIDQAVTHLGGKATAVVMRRLAALPDATAICHGDMHPGNVLLTPNGPVVIDWLTATSGPPAADIARSLFLLRDAAVPEVAPAVERAAISLVRRVFAARYLTEYRRRGSLDPDVVARWRLPVLAARLSEVIEKERTDLLAAIDAELAASPR
jgi:aminoglycoside phosphotransferase (APT) family kinase protein